jgi:serine/threonine protein kinase
MTDYTGQRFGNYELVSMLGRGGFAQVYLGEQIFLKTQAAIKVLDAPLEDENIEQFRVEAGTIAHLDHPHIVRLLDFGIEHTTPYLVMAYAPNGTLRQRHPLGMPVPLPTVIRYVQQVASALQYAHQQRIIHRDVKPENLLVGRKNEVLLSDFGIAVVAHRTNAMTTQDQAGTVNYMAPEQLRKKPHPASDQYALAVMVYEWLTGSSPFEGSAIEIAVQHLQTPPPPLRQPGNGISADVERVVLRAMEKHWQMRFASVWDFAIALQEAYSPHPPFTRVPSGDIAPAPPAPVDLLDEAPTAAPPIPSSAATPPSILPADLADRETWKLPGEESKPTPVNPAGGGPADLATRPPGAGRPPDDRRAGARRLNRRTALLALVALLFISLVSAGGLLFLKGAPTAPASIGTGPGINPTQGRQPGATPFPGGQSTPGATATTPGASSTPGATSTRTPTGSASPTATAAPSLSVRPASLSFPVHLLSCLVNNQPKTLTVQNTGGGTLSWQATIPGSASLKISPGSGTLGPQGTGSVSVTVDCSKLAVSENDTITFTSNGGSFSVSVTITLS